MITTLTKKQEDMIVPFREKWKARILRTEQTDEQIIKGVQSLYKEAGFKKPKVFIMDSPLGSQVFANILKENKLEMSNIGSNIGSNIRSNILSNIWSNIGSNIESNIWSSKLDFFTFSSNDSSWIHWYVNQKYYLDSGLLKKDIYSRKLDKYLNNVIDTWMCLYFDGVAIVSRKPKVRLNTNEFLHSDEFPAVEFNDGYKLYYLNGVNFKEELWRKVVSRSMSLKEVMEIVDIDQRTQAMKYVDVKELIKEFNGETLSTYTKFTPDGKEVNYSLVKIPKNDKLFTIDSYHAVYTCPSTDKVYMSGIDPEIGKNGDIKECMAWKSKMTIEQWETLIPLVTES